MNIEKLITEARRVQENAYSPYSNFKVGAALLGRQGKVYTGVNVENASYGLTVCAERVAAFKAVSDGETKFKYIAVTGSGNGYIYPCGACLQVLAEFSDDLKVIITDENNNYKEYSLNEMLPQAFKTSY